MVLFFADILPWKTPKLFLIKIWLKFVPVGSIHDKSRWIQVKDWRQLEMDKRLQSGRMVGQL